MPERNNREHTIDMSPAASYDPLGALFTAQKLEDYAAASAAAGDKALAAAAYSAAANELTRAAATHAGSMLGAAGLVASASTLLRKSTTIRVAAEQSRPWSPLMLYQSRRGSTTKPKSHETRNVMNEPAVIAAVSRVAAARGYDFKVVSSPGNATVWDWHRADIVIAAHGGAMANMVHMRPNTSVVELNKFMGRQCFAGMSYALQLRYHAYVPARFGGYNRHRCELKHCAIIVDPGDLAAFVSGALAG